MRCWLCEEIVHTWTNSGFPKRKALSRFFLKASSRKLVLVILRSLYSFIMNSVAWPDGSMISGYLEKGNSTELISMGYELNPRLIYAQEYFVMFLGFKKYYVRRKRY